MFVVLFGSLLGACALACRPGAAMRFEHALACLCLLGAAASPYLGGHTSARGVSLASEMRHPDMSRGGGCKNYRLLHRHPRFGDVACPYAVNFAPEPRESLRSYTCPVAAAQAGDTVTVMGEAEPGSSGALKLRVGLGGVPLGSQRLARGKFTACFRVPAAAAGHDSELTVHTLGEGSGTPAVRIELLAFGPGPAGPGHIGYIGPDCTRGATTFGRDTTVRTSLAEPAYVVLPILSYPHVLRVRDNGQEMPYGCVDEYVLVQLPAGPHVIEVRYVGVRWANRLSLTAAVVLVLGLAGCLAHAMLRRRAARVPSPSPVRLLAECA
jgi:hypothetical protein